MKNHSIRPFLFFLFASLLLSVAAPAQIVVIRIGQHPGNNSVSGWNPAQAPAANSVASQAPHYVQEIMSTLGLAPNFEVRAARVDNAAAVVYGGKRYILYNPDFIDALVRRTGNQWAAVSVLAHEIGHHLDGHTVASTSSQPALELEADEFSGFVLRKMGASLADAQAAMKTISTEAASATHPGRTDRLASIARGWNSATAPGNSTALAREIQQQPVIAAQDPVAQTASYPTRRNTTLSPDNILARLSFSNDPGADYFVTAQFNVVKLENNRAYVIGRMTRLENRSFPFLIYDRQNTKLLVHSSGAILTESGRSVGRLTVRNS